MKPATHAAVLEPLSAKLLGELRRVRRNPAREGAVHDARVAARRLLAAGRLWAPPGRGWEDVRDRLPRVIRRLGRVRNLDVILGLLRRGPAAEREAREELAALLRKRRRKQRQKLKAWLSKKRLDRLDADLRRMLKGTRGDPTPRLPAPPDLGPPLAHILRLTRAPEWLDDAKRSHEVRREVRLLRYAFETLAPAFAPTSFGRIRRAFREAQNAAGEWHDRWVLGRVVEKASQNGELDVALHRVLARTRRERRALSARFARAMRGLLALGPVIAGENR